jgi:hypothetical protein
VLDCSSHALSVQRPIDPPWSSCLWRASSPVRQHAIPRRKNTPAQPAFPYIFSSALRAAGRSMEALRSSLASHSDTANLLSKLRSSSLFGTGRSRAAALRHLLEGSRRRRRRLAMRGCFPICMAHESLRRRGMASHDSASCSSPTSHRLAAQLGLHASEGHDGPEERSVCVRNFGALRLFVLLCSCPSQAVSVGVEGKNYQYLKLIAIVDSTVR